MKTNHILQSQTATPDEMTAPYCIVLHQALNPNEVVVHFFNFQTQSYSCGDYFLKSEFKQAVVCYELRCKMNHLEPYPQSEPTTKNIN